MKILLVEDEELLSNAIAKGLKRLGFAVDQAYDGEAALYSYEVNAYDLIILDLNLPIIDGIEVLRQIRESDFEMKILILSARSDTNDRVLGLNEGANDYLIKPFDFEELVARIHNLIRRTFSQTPSVLSIGGVTIDVLAKAVTLDKSPLPLTNKEYSILEYLMLNQGRVIPQSELIEHVWDSEADLFSNALKFQLHSLKKKLGEADIICNVRGQGYTIKGDHVNE
ncbi:response regulator transcription factor [Hydrogenoanaerobacterium sp.]|uniref:response regulator transcription factor n=1 Tax=Hydrogenoanaerobacterium sp. TaxID=2953763 RepID=UPI002897CEF8|nr:response regulator transcription factor [Hydrogenoanaerobacterium sp.]